MASNSVFVTAVNIIAAPREALGAIRDEPKILLPLIAILIANTAVIFSYYTQVDLAWTIEAGMEGALEDMNPRQREAATARLENLSPTFVASAGSASSAVFFTLWFLVNAAYLTGVSQFTGDGIRIKQWYAMLCWCGLPIILGHAASLANINLSDATFLRPDRMNPLSISSLLNLESAAGSSMRQSLQAMDLTTIWSIGLGVYAYHTWTAKDLFESALIFLAPAILFFSGVYFFTGS